VPFRSRRLSCWRRLARWGSSPGASTPTRVNCTSAMLCKACRESKARLHSTK
jgi:hypothetical protein